MRKKISFSKKEIETLKSILPLLIKIPFSNHRKKEWSTYNWIKELTVFSKTSQICAREILQFSEDIKFIAEKHGILIANLDSINNKFNKTLIG